MKRRARRDRRQYVCGCPNCAFPFEGERRFVVNGRGMSGRRANEEDYPARSSIRFHDTPKAESA